MYSIQREMSNDTETGAKDTEWPRPSGHLQHHVSMSLSELNSPSRAVDELGLAADMDETSYGGVDENLLVPVG